eukprot:767492-Hanusia_phi.AAC.7
MSYIAFSPSALSSLSSYPTYLPYSSLPPFLPSSLSLSNPHLQLNPLPSPLIRSSLHFLLPPLALPSCLLGVNNSEPSSPSGDMRGRDAAALLVATMAGMMTGSSVVHWVMKPDLSLPEVEVAARPKREGE